MSGCVFRTMSPLPVINLLIDNLWFRTLPQVDEVPRKWIWHLSWKAREAESERSDRYHRECRILPLPPDHPPNTSVQHMSFPSRHMSILNRGVQDRERHLAGQCAPLAGTSSCEMGMHRWCSAYTRQQGNVRLPVWESLGMEARVSADVGTLKGHLRLPAMCCGIK
jgi:hypothetical protein